MLKTILIIVLVYLAFRLLKGQIPKLRPRDHPDKAPDADDALDIREENIRDAEYKDLEE